MRGHMRQRGDAWELRAYVWSRSDDGRAKIYNPLVSGGKGEADVALARFVTEVSGGGHAAQRHHPQRPDPSMARTSLGKTSHHRRFTATNESSAATSCPTSDESRLAKLRTDQLDRFYTNLRGEGGKDGRPALAGDGPTDPCRHPESTDRAMRWGWIAANRGIAHRPLAYERRLLHPPEP